VSHCEENGNPHKTASELIASRQHIAYHRVVIFTFANPILGPIRVDCEDSAMQPKAPKITVNCAECNTPFQTRPLELGQSQPLVIPVGADQNTVNRLQMAYDSAQQRHNVWTQLCPSCAALGAKADIKSDQKIGFKTAIAKRWNEILADPKIIQQDCFGICGFSSCLYVLLKHTNRTKAVELYEATFADVIPAFAGRQFTPATGAPQSINLQYLARKYYASQIGAGWGTTVYFVDYCVSRAIGYLLKKLDNTRYQAEKTEFNKEWGFPSPGSVGPPDYHSFTRAGNLAARSNNLAFVLTKILGAQGVTVWRKSGASADSLAPAVGGVAVKQFGTADGFLQIMKDNAAIPRSFAIVAVLANTGPASEFPGPGNTQQLHSPSQGSLGKSGAALKYNHWIVIESTQRILANVIPGPQNSLQPKPCQDEHIKMKIWTWANMYEPTVCKKHALSYIQDVITGHF
jgi:hypothetical protein